MSSIQTLITTMKLQDAQALLASMNLQGHRTIIGNQCSENGVQQLGDTTVVSTSLRGVGQNRNNIIERADADICVLADDDMRFCDEYGQIVSRVFEENPDADVIIFNFIEKSEGRRVVQKKHRVSVKNYMNYGAARFAFRRAPIAYHAISFNTMFGGGTPHHCGEDSLFLNSCLKAGLKVIVVPDALATLTEERESTWFSGYTDKYLYDKGVFLGIAHPRLAKPMALLLVAKHKEYREGRSFYECYKHIEKGIAHARKRFRA